jgi:hypothetical protein
MTQRCKRDALPTELTARAPEMAAFRPILNSGFSPVAERSGNKRHRAVLRVPKNPRSGFDHIPDAGKMVVSFHRPLRCQGRDTSPFPYKTAVFRCSNARTARERMGNRAPRYRGFTAQVFA